MIPVNTVGWMCWQYINNYFWWDLNSVAWVSVGWLILPEDRYVRPEFYDRCQIYRNVVWGRSSYWQSNEKLVGRLMLKPNCVVPPSLCVFDKWCWGSREGVILSLEWAKRGKIWRNNNINQCDNFHEEIKNKCLFEREGILGGLVNVAEWGEQTANQTVWPKSFKVTAVLTTYMGLIFSQC